MCNDQYENQRTVMRAAVKARLLELLANDVRGMKNFERHEDFVRTKIAQACDAFIKPTRRGLIVEKIALDVMQQLSKLDLSNKYLC